MKIRQRAKALSRLFATRRLISRVSMLIPKCDRLHPRALVTAQFAEGLGAITHFEARFRSASLGPKRSSRAREVGGLPGT